MEIVHFAYGVGQLPACLTASDTYAAVNSWAGVTCENCLRVRLAEMGIPLPDRHDPVAVDAWLDA